MNSKEVVGELEERYPGKNIILIPPANPTEIICELEPTGDHPEHSVAIAVVDESARHYNDETEEYHVIKGRLVLIIAGVEYKLEEGDKRVIRPGFVHSAKADAAWVQVTTRPGWTPEGHHLVES